MSTKHPASVLPGTEIDIDTRTDPDYTAPADGTPYYLIGDERDNTLTGGEKADTFYGGLGTNHLDGGNGNDWFIIGDPGSGFNYVEGGLGTNAGDHDTVDFSGANAGVTVNLEYGWGGVSYFDNNIQDVEDVVGSNYNDIITGDSGANVLNGGAGADILEGGAGKDVLNGFGTSGAFAGGFVPTELAPNNTASYEHSDGPVTVNLATGATSGGDAEGDTLIDIQNLTGSGFDGDELIGDSGANVLNGGFGDDLLRGGGGADTFIGGEDRDGQDVDTVSFLDAQHGVTASLATGTGTAGDGSQVTFDGIEALTGSKYKDTLTGDGNHNVLDGGKGNDTLDGKGGDDTLTGGLGVDTMTGGKGKDTFAFLSVDDSTTAPNAHDTITDFSVSDDKIDLSAIAKTLNISQFTLVDSNVSPVAGDIQYHTTTDSSGATNTFVDIHTNNSGGELFLELSGDVQLTQNNFISH